MSGLPFCVIFILGIQGVLGGGLSFFEDPDPDLNQNDVSSDIRDIKDLLMKIWDYVTDPGKLFKDLGNWTAGKIKTGITWIGGTISGFLHWLDGFITSAIFFGAGMDPSDPANGEKTMIVQSVRLIGSALVIAGLWFLFRLYTLGLNILPLV